VRESAFREKSIPTERVMAESGGRRIGVAVDFSDCSKKALSWAIDNVVRDGDHLILITIAHDMNYEEGEMQLWETVGSRTFLISLSLSLSNSFSPLYCFPGNVI